MIGPEGYERARKAKEAGQKPVIEDPDQEHRHRLHAMRIEGMRAGDFISAEARQRARWNRGF